MRNAKVAIVGSGVAGATVADILLSRSVADQIVMFEAGPHLRMAERRTWLEYVTTGWTGWRPYSDSADKDAEIDGDPKAFAVPGGRLMVVGGSTVHWGGWCPRMKPEDFEMKSRTGQGLDWPISYAQLASYYDKAERRLRIAGDSKRNDPPRFGSAFPVPAVPLTQMDGPVVKAFQSLGYTNYGNLPITRNEQCVTTGTCRYCPVGGKYDATMDLRKVAGDKFELRAKTPVIEIVMKNKREAAGVKFKDPADGKERVESFDYVFVCAGAIESAKLLLASRSFWPQGLGNDTGHVGRHLTSHPRIQASGVLPANPQAYSQELDFPTLECRHFDTPEYQREGKFFFVRDDRETTLDYARELVLERLKPDEVQRKLLGEVTFTLSGFVEEFETEGNRVELAPGTTRFGLPRTRVYYATPDKTRAAKLAHLANLDKVLKAMGVREDRIEHLKTDNPRSDHAAGTCRMSQSAALGVVNSDLKVHDCDNVYVCSNAVFPNIGAVNPTLTLVALATRMAEAA